MDETNWECMREEVWEHITTDQLRAMFAGGQEQWNKGIVELQWKGDTKTWTVTLYVQRGKINERQSA